MTDNERREYLISTKKKCFWLGFICMIGAAFVLVTMFVVCCAPDGSIRYFPERLFWGLQIFDTGIFLIGAVGYLVSLTIRIED